MPAAMIQCEGPRSWVNRGFSFWGTRAVFVSVPMPRTLLDWLNDRYPTAKRQTLRRMVSDGRVFVNGSRARAVNIGIDEADRIDVRERSRDEPDSPSKSGLHI